MARSKIPRLCEEADRGEADVKADQTRLEDRDREMPNPRSDPHLCISSAVEKGLSHYVRNRAHVWSTKEVQIIDRIKSAEISAKCAKARF